MKEHKFKLEAVLKIRKIKEDICKMELGKIQLRISELESFMNKHLEDIEKGYDEQEQFLKAGMSVREMQKFPILISEKKKHIKRIRVELEDLQENQTIKLGELARLKGDVKVISNMKEKSLIQHKKKINKKKNEALEEQIQNWNLFKGII